MFVVFAWATIDLLEIAWPSRSVPCSEKSNVTGTCNHGEVRSRREVRWQHIRYCNLAKQCAGFWDIGKRVNVGMEYVLVGCGGPIVLASEWKSRTKGTGKHLLRMREDVRSMKRENSFPWQVNPGHESVRRRLSDWYWMVETYQAWRCRMPGVRGLPQGQGRGFGIYVYG